MHWLLTFWRRMIIECKPSRRFISNWNNDTLERCSMLLDGKNRLLSIRTDVWWIVSFDHTQHPFRCAIHCKSEQHSLCSKVRQDWAVFVHNRWFYTWSVMSSSVHYTRQRWFPTVEQSDRRKSDGKNLFDMKDKGSTHQQFEHRFHLLDEHGHFLRDLSKPLDVPHVWCRRDPVISHRSVWYSVHSTVSKAAADWCHVDRELSWTLNYFRCEKFRQTEHGISKECSCCLRPPSDRCDAFLTFWPHARNDRIRTVIQQSFKIVE